MSPVLEPQENLATKPIKIKSPIKRMKREEKKKSCAGEGGNMVSEREIPFQILPHRSSQWFGFYFQSIPIRSHCATASKED